MEDPRQYIVRTSGDGLTRGVFRGLSMTHPNRLDMTEWPGKISDEQWMSDNTYAMHSTPTPSESSIVCWFLGYSSRFAVSWIF